MKNYLHKTLPMTALLISALLFNGAALAHADQHKPATIVTTSHFDFSATKERILNEIQKRNLTLFAELDHAAAARASGLEMPDTTVLVFGNPKGGTPLMLKYPSLALDLPYRVLIAQQADGKVKVSSPAPDTFRVHGLNDQQIALLAKMPEVIDAALKH